MRRKIEKKKNEKEKKGSKGEKEMSNDVFLEMSGEVLDPLHVVHDEAVVQSTAHNLLN